MFTYKNNYYLYTENIKTLNLSLIKKRNKFIIIYRNNSNRKNISQLKKFFEKMAFIKYLAFDKL